MRTHLATLASTFALTLAPAQQPDGVPVQHTLHVAPGAWVDLDSGLILSAREHRPFQADLHFDRDGRGRFVLPLHGGATCPADAQSPAGDWSDQRLHLPDRGVAPRTWFLRTERGSVARVTLAVIETHSNSAVVLRWVLAPPALPVFLPAPRELHATWQDGALELTWQGQEPRFLVEVHTGNHVRKLTCPKPPLRIDELAPDGVHLLRVRGITTDNVVTLPAEITAHGQRRPPRRGQVPFPDRWYDGPGGIAFAEAHPVAEAADVAFYLYGVYVPGGGVQKLGVGEDAWLSTTTLPEQGYLPVYGRLDDDDVLAVRTADRRHGLLWLRPDRTDLRQGMTVHFAFLPDGRRSLLPAPAAASFQPEAGGLRLRWPAVQGASAYRVWEPGRAVPTDVASPDILLAGLVADRLATVAIAAVGADGECSAPRSVEVHTFGAGYRVGTFQLDNGARLAQCLGEDRQVAVDWHDPPAAADLWISGSAGGMSSLEFMAPHGTAEAGALPFGVFPAAGQELQFRDRHRFDDREPDSARFLVRTRDGGLASVRVGRRQDGRARFDYVLRLPVK